MSKDLTLQEWIATWPIPNYTNPPSYGSSLIIFTGVTFGLTTIALCLRLYTRALIKRSLELDDLFILLSYIFSIGLNTCILVAFIHLGAARHTWDIPPKWWTPLFYIGYLTEIFYLLTGFFTTASMMTFYYRLNRHANIRWFAWALHISCTFVLLSVFIFFWITVFQCHPVSSFWTNINPSTCNCIDERVIGFGGGFIKLLADVIITTLPIPLVANMTLARRQKIIVIVLFATAYIVAAAGIVRMYYTYVMYWQTWDRTWSQYLGIIASVVENDLGIICTCVIALRPLVRKWLAGGKEMRNHKHAVGKGVDQARKGDGTVSEIHGCSLQSKTTNGSLQSRNIGSCLDGKGLMIRNGVDDEEQSSGKS